MQLTGRSIRHFVSVPSNFIYLLLLLLCNNFQQSYCFSTPTPSTTSTLSIVPHREDSSNYLDILASDTPLLDTRAPIEFNKGSFPNSANHPLLNDKQRELIGTCYNKHGQEAAISLGYELLDNEEGLKERLVQSWIEHITKYPNGYLYCFRGGLRSHLVQLWIQEATGIHYPLIIGGYKAIRTSLLDDLQVSLDTLPFVLLGGRTCSGKTIALKHMKRYVDLEGLANHRGSAFGGIAQDEQPSQIDFENAIIIECLKHRKSSSTHPVLMEDEGHRIGKLTLPIPMHGPMANDFPLVVLETPLEERIDICIEEYVTKPYQTYLESGKDIIDDTDNKKKAHASIRNTSLDSVRRINKGLQKKWGGTVNQGFDILGAFEKGFLLFESSNASDTSGFRKPVQLLLEDYYDPMYDYQMDKRKGEVLFRGSMDEIIQWAEHYSE